MIATIISVVALIFSVSSWLGYRLLWDKRDLDANTAILMRVEQTLDRMELASFVVAADLSTAQHIVDKVATDLGEAQKRADEITTGTPGEAADAGAQSARDSG